MKDIQRLTPPSQTAFPRGHLQNRIYGPRDDLLLVYPTLSKDCAYFAKGLKFGASWANQICGATLNTVSRPLFL